MRKRGKAFRLLRFTVLLMGEIDRRSFDARNEVALAWFVRMQSGDATESDRTGHAEWLAASPENRVAYARLGTLWGDLDRVPDPRLRTAHVPTAASSPGMGRRAFLTGSAATVGLAGYVTLAGLPDFWTSDYATGTAEQRDVALADGSRMSLDADTAVAVDFTDQQRRVALLRGRAYFNVAKNSLRPFVVDAAKGTTTALGTRFAVHEWDGTVTVAVEESAVSVAAPDGSVATLRVGQNASYGRDGISEIGAVDIVNEMAWRRGKLIFEDRPLRQVIADVNRYRPGTIQITDRRLNNLRVSGIFDVRNPEGVLDAIGAALPVRLTRLTDYIVLVRPA